MFGTTYTGGIMDYRSASEINSAMARVYGHMSVAVIISMLVSWFVGTTPELLSFFFTGILKWIVIFAPLAAILALTFASERFNTGQLKLFLYGFAALMGLSFATIFAVFTMGSIVSAFMGARSEERRVGKECVA
jgi:FtsH-binding integral membrane protein